MCEDRKEFPTPAVEWRGPEGEKIPDSVAADMYEEMRTLMGYSATDECETRRYLRQRILYYGSAVLIGILIHLMLKKIGLL